MALTKAPKAPEVPLQELIQASYSQLFQVAEALSTPTSETELSDAVGVLETAIGRL